MTNYHWIYYDKENINKLYEQDEKITQQELMNEKQQEQKIIYAHSTMTLLPGKRTNGYMLYQKVLHDWLWKENKHINIQRERIAVNALLWKNLTPEQKQYFGYHAKLLNNQYKSQ